MMKYRVLNLNGSVKRVQELIAMFLDGRIDIVIRSMNIWEVSSTGDTHATIVYTKKEFNL